MAHHKRKRPRSLSRRVYDKWASEKLPYYRWLSAWPASWDIVQHTRPTRVRNRATLSRIKKGTLDPDDGVFLNGKKPHIYYW